MKYVHSVNHTDTKIKGHYTIEMIMIMERDTDHLTWIYDRLINEYGENESFDYMTKFSKIIEKSRRSEDWDDHLRLVHQKQDICNCMSYYKRSYLDTDNIRRCDDCNKPLK